MRQLDLSNVPIAYISCLVAALEVYTASTRRFDFPTGVTAQEKEALAQYYLDSNDPLLTQLFVRLLELRTEWVKEGQDPSDAMDLISFQPLPLPARKRTSSVPFATQLRWVSIFPPTVGKA